MERVIKWLKRMGFKAGYLGVGGSGRECWDHTTMRVCIGGDVLEVVVFTSEATMTVLWRMEFPCPDRVLGVPEAVVLAALKAAWTLEQAREQRAAVEAAPKLDGPRYPQVRVRLSGEDGNAFAILGRARAAARRAGLSASEVAEYHQAATAGSYDDLLRTTMRYFDCT